MVPQKKSDGNEDRSWDPYEADTLSTELPCPVLCTINEHGSISVRNSVFNCKLLPLDGNLQWKTLILRLVDTHYWIA